MDARLKKEDLMRALAGVRAGLAQREIIEQSVCFVFQNGRVFTYNDEAFASGPSGLPEDYVGVVPAVPLLEALARIDADELRVRDNEGRLSISAGKTLVWLDAETDVRLPVKNVEPPGKWRPLPEAFVDAVHLVQQCAGKDEAAWVLTCVNLAPGWVEACDEYQVCRWRLETGLKEPTIVKRAALETVQSLGVTEVSVTPSWLHFRNARGFQLSCRRYVDEFPSDKLTGVLERAGRKVTLPKGLKAACELANVFSSQTADVNLVTVTVRQGRVTVEGSGTGGGARRSEPANWDGEPVTFMIPPAVLAEVAERYNDVELSEDAIRVVGGDFTYVTSLQPPEGSEEAPPEKPKKARKKQEATADE